MPIRRLISKKKKLFKQCELFLIFFQTEKDRQYQLVYHNLKKKLFKLPKQPMKEQFCGAL